MLLEYDEGSNRAVSPSSYDPLRDDEAGTLYVRRILLERAGYSVRTATNAGEALTIFGSSKIDVVVSDHLLPGVMGTEMARQMKLAKPDVPILLLSGVVDLPDGPKHTDRFLGKSEGPSKLLQTIAELLRYRRLRIDDGNYCAQIACDTLTSPTVWHYVICRVGSSEMLSWSQAPTEKAAIAAAKKELGSLNRETAPTKARSQSSAF